MVSLGVCTSVLFGIWNVEITLMVVHKTLRSSRCVVNEIKKRRFFIAWCTVLQNALIARRGMYNVPFGTIGISKNMHKK